MKRRLKRSSDTGSVLIELALTLPLIVSIAVMMFFFSQALQSYTLAQKASHDAARYLASIDKTEMRSLTRIGEHLAVTRAIIAEETAGIHAEPYAPSVSISCGVALCDGYVIPDNVTVTIRLIREDLLFGDVTSDVTGGQLRLTAATTMPFVGI